METPGFRPMLAPEAAVSRILSALPQRYALLLNIQTINFSQTRRGPWKSRASEMAHAEGQARQPEDLQGLN